MREIKFRGKRVDNGEWVVGDYTRYSDKKSIITVDLLEQEDYWVSSETVGQSTGLKDKNGKEIYEGDLLTDMVGDVFEVFYNTAHCAYMTEYVRTKHAEKKRGYFRLGDQCSLTIEVIGNVFENKELLGEL